MLIPLNQVLTTFEGIDLFNAVTKKPITVKSSIIEALLSQKHFEDQIKAHNLAKMIHKYSLDDIDLRAEDIVLIKAASRLAGPPIIAGQLVEILDPKEEETSG